MSKICPLYSSSSGNCTYIGCRGGSILVDAGASFKGIREALARFDASTDELLAVAVTHEHTDHVKGLKTLLNKTNACLITSEKTAKALIDDGKVPAKTKIIIADEQTVEIGGIAVSRFATSHDCEGSSGYSLILDDNKKAVICTDLGIITPQVSEALTNAELVLLESNHDIEMLKRGPYPPELKLRILSEKGHLSNVACSTELKRLLKQGTRRFILGHLSRHNNTPMLAKSSATAALMDLGAQIDKDYLLTVAKPSDNGVTVI